MRVFVLLEFIAYRKHCENLIKAIDNEIEVRGFSNQSQLMNALSDSFPDLIIFEENFPEFNLSDLLDQLKKKSKQTYFILTQPEKLPSRHISILKDAFLEQLALPKLHDTEENRLQKEKFEDELRKILSLAKMKISLGQVKNQSPVKEDNKIEERKYDFSQVEVVGIGISTGGPESLAQLVPHLKKNLSFPILIVQHISGPFAETLAHSLGEKTSLKVQKANNYQEVHPGQIYIAPGEHQMKIEIDVKTNKKVIVLTDDPPLNSCKPAVDYLFDSLAQVYKKQVVGIVMTGMGQDGLIGATQIKKNGGYIAVQDKESSIVFGMPMKIIENKLEDKILSLHAIADFINSLGLKTN
jgi:two-component system chemotaxis response regulator CheB